MGEATGSMVVSMCCVSVPVWTVFVSVCKLVHLPA